MNNRTIHQAVLTVAACLTAVGAGLWPASHATGAAGPPSTPGGETLPATNRCRLILPAEIHAVVGREINLYFDNVVLVPNWRNLIFDVTCAKGIQQSERWTCVPEAKDVGVHPLRVEVYDADGQCLASAGTRVCIAPATAGTGRSIRLLCIGDSLTNASVYPEELLLLCKEDGNPQLTLLGTNQPNPARPELRHEGYGGWTYERFLNHYAPPPDASDPQKRGSPFVFLENGKPQYDFPRYVREKCEGKPPDFVTIALGCNDIFGATEAESAARVDTVLASADTMVAGIRQASPETRIGLVMLVPPAATQDAFGANYQCGQTRWQYRRNQHRMVERMLQKYSGKEAERIFLIPAYLNLDTERNYPGVEVLANARATVKVFRLNNGVHPAASGYRQMADSIYAWMKWQLATLP